MQARRGCWCLHIFVVEPECHRSLGAAALRQSPGQRIGVAKVRGHHVGKKIATCDSWQSSTIARSSAETALRDVAVRKNA